MSVSNVTPWDLIEGSGPDVATALTALIDHLADLDAERILDGRVLEDLYRGFWVSSEDLSPGVLAYGAMGGDPVKLNFARNATDFVHNKLTTETPAVTAGSTDGTFSSDRKAQDLSRKLEELWSDTGADRLLKSAVLSGLRTGTAIVKAIPASHEEGRPFLEAVPTEWVFVDPAEARCGQPRSIYERRPVPRRYVHEAFTGDDDEMRTAVDSAGPPTDPLFNDSNPAPGSPGSDLIDVYEAWTLPSDDGERPGRHVVCVRGAVLIDEEWTLSRFPHSFLRISEPAPGRGFWGQGLLEQLDEPQAEIDYLLGQVSEQIRLSRLRFMVQASESVSDDVVASMFNGDIIRYENAPPQALTPPTMNKEAFDHIQWLVSQLYQQVGMSEQAASSQRPAGINSGRAILFFHDFQTRRYADLVDRYGCFAVDVAKRLLDAADVERPEGTGVRLEEVSPVPSTYAGRTQRIEQLIAQGQVPEGYWTQYLSNPDAYRAEHRASSQADYLEWIMDQLLDTDVELPQVNDHLDFDLALEVLNGEILTLNRKKADPGVIDRFEDFFDSVTARQAEVRSQQQMQAGPVPQAPAAQAPELPMGGLLPSAPGATG